MRNRKTTYYRLIVIIIAIVVFMHKYENKPILPICVTCHNTGMNNKKIPEWLYRHGHVFCIDHIRMDGLKMSQKRFKLAASPENPPSRVLYSAKIDDLMSEQFTKYEIFCARVGRLLKKQYKDLKIIRHTAVDRNSRKFLFYGNSSTVFVDAPIGKRVHIKELPRRPLFGRGGIDLIRSLWGPKEDNIIRVKDWRFLHDEMNVNIDNPCTNIHGKEENSWMVTILKTSDTYYAVGPTGVHAFNDHTSGSACRKHLTPNSKHK